MSVTTSNAATNLDLLMRFIAAHHGTVALREVVYDGDLRQVMGPADLRAAMDLGFQRGTLSLGSDDFALTAVESVAMPATA